MSETKIEPLTSQTDALHNKASTSPTRATGSSRGIVAILFGIIAMGIASYSGYMTLQMGQARVAADADRTTDLVAWQDALAKLQQQIDTLAISVAANTGAIAAELGESSALEQKLELSLLEIKALVGASSQDWLLAEVEYLIRLANQRLLMEQDASGAVALFLSADGILRDVEGIAAFELRQQLADDIADLRALGRLDVDGLFVKIGALIRQVDKLQPKRLQYTKAPAKAVDAVPAIGWSAKSWAMLGAIGRRLASLVDYRREAEVIQPILPPKEEYYLRQNLVLKLQLAQLGLLRADQQVYAMGLADAEAWMSGYYDPQHPASISFIATLRDLTAVDVDRTLPDVSGSLQAARKLLARFHQEAADRVEK